MDESTSKLEPASRPAALNAPVRWHLRVVPGVTVSAVDLLRAPSAVAPVTVTGDRTQGAALASWESEGGRLLNPGAPPPAAPSAPLS